MIHRFASHDHTDPGLEAAWCSNSSEVIWKHYAGVSQEYVMPVL